MGLFGHNNLVNIVYCSLIGILVNVNTGCCVCINCLQCQTLLLNISLCEIGYVVVDIRLNVFVKYNLLQLIMYHQTYHLIIIRSPLVIHCHLFVIDSLVRVVALVLVVKLSSLWTGYLNHQSIQYT